MAWRGVACVNSGGGIIAGQEEQICNRKPHVLSLQTNLPPKLLHRRIHHPFIHSCVCLLPFRKYSNRDPAAHDSSVSVRLEIRQLRELSKGWLGGTWMFVHVTRSRVVLGASKLKCILASGIRKFGDLSTLFSLTSISHSSWSRISIYPRAPHVRVPAHMICSRFIVGMTHKLVLMFSNYLLKNIPILIHTHTHTHTMRSNHMTWIPSGGFMILIIYFFILFKVSWSRVLEVKNYEIPFHKLGILIYYSKPTIGLN